AVAARAPGLAVGGTGHHAEPRGLCDLRAPHHHRGRKARRRLGRGPQPHLRPARRAPRATGGPGAPVLPRPPRPGPGRTRARTRNPAGGEGAGVTMRRREFLLSGGLVTAGVLASTV